ncbi:hypothetical protein TOPH_01568 [Tolypocladium ophioglossoides CBS 100239]|uniref:Methyltransferase type 11 domain-containing protein n=1 Tax=Tolypocladium ophioglossoides (strain CBS 100239) TaxID=1163406 RepID=A0A0L0NIR6_TOLOC|nr:hypothetical protein TOPH_01568 [Tolypocladium ophioglossoides CBS 100239]
MAVYDEAHQQSSPEDHIQTLAHANPPPAIPSQPDFGLDSLFGLLASFVAAPLYLYASLRGKFQVWDEILDGLPDSAFAGPALDVGCGRGMVLLKTAQRKKKLLASSEGEAGIAPAYGIDIFSTADQTGNSPLATYKNAAALSVVPHTVLHTASFTARLPFADAAFALVTSNLALHNAPREGRLAAVKEMARVCAPGGSIVIVDLYGYFKDHRATL